MTSGVVSPAVRFRAAVSYNAAADRYDHPSNAFWTRFGEATIDRVELRPGQRVLDVCCGTGASALAAARWVGPRGSVVAVDVAAELLERARRKAAAGRRRNIEFRLGDMLEITEPDEAFDAVVCAFGIHFADDMPAAVRELWRLVRPGGTLAITTWGPERFEPMNSVFWSAIASVRPDLRQREDRWTRIASVVSLRAMLACAGLEAVSIEAEAAIHPLSGPADWWTLVMGSGYRGTVEQLTRSQRDEVCAVCARRYIEGGVGHVNAPVLYATARKPDR